MVVDLHDPRVSRHGDAAISAAYLTDALYYEPDHRQLSRVLFYRSAMLGRNTEAEAARCEALARTLFDLFHTDGSPLSRMLTQLDADDLWIDVSEWQPMRFIKKRRLLDPELDALGLRAIAEELRIRILGYRFKKDHKCQSFAARWEEWGRHTVMCNHDDACKGFVRVPDWEVSQRVYLEILQVLPSPNIIDLFIGALIQGYYPATRASLELELTFENARQLIGLLDHACRAQESAVPRTIANHTLELPRTEYHYERAYLEVSVGSHPGCITLKGWEVWGLLDANNAVAVLAMNVAEVRRLVSLLERDCSRLERAQQL